MAAVNPADRRGQEHVAEPFKEYISLILGPSRAPVRARGTRRPRADVEADLGRADRGDRQALEQEGAHVLPKGTGDHCGTGLCGEAFPLGDDEMMRTFAPFEVPKSTELAELPRAGLASMQTVARLASCHCRP